MNKYIFLDIDGVLAIPNTKWKLSFEKQMLLGKILAQTDAKIVLSSSWRYSTVVRTTEHLLSEGFLFNESLIGVTIRAYQYIASGDKIHLSIPRGVEIKQWIDTHVHSDNGKNWNRQQLGVDYNYVILDDDTDMLLEQKDNFINTNFETGLTEENVVNAIKILNQ